MNEKVRAFLLIPPALALIGAVIAAPQIVHVMDSGSTVATVAEIASGKLTSRNVTVTAFAFPMRGLRQVVTNKKSQNEPAVSFFMPIADQPGEASPSLVIVESFRNEVSDAAERPDVPQQYEGTVRDVLWEGLDSAVKRDLETVHPLSPQVKLLRLRGGRDFGDFAWAYGLPLMGFFLGLLAASNFKPQPKGAA